MQTIDGKIAILGDNQTVCVNLLLLTYSHLALGWQVRSSVVLIATEVAVGTVLLTLTHVNLEVQVHLRQCLTGNTSGNIVERNFRSLCSSGSLCCLRRSIGENANNCQRKER